MPTYRYVARTMTTYSQVVGEVEAPNVDVATDRIRRRSLKPEEIVWVRGWTAGQWAGILSLGVGVLGLLGYAALKCWFK